MNTKTKKNHARKGHAQPRKKREAPSPLRIDHENKAQRVTKLVGLRAKAYASWCEHVDAHNMINDCRKAVIEYPGVGTDKGGRLLEALAGAVEVGRALLGEIAPKDEVRLRLPSNIRAEINAQYAEAERLAERIAERKSKHAETIKSLDEIIFMAGVQHGGDSMEALFEPQSAKIAAISSKKQVVATYKKSMKALAAQFQGAYNKAVSMWKDAIRDHQVACRAALIEAAKEMMPLLSKESDLLEKGFKSFDAQVSKAKAAADIAYETLRKHNIRKESEEDSLAHELLRDAAAAGRKDKRVIKAEQFLRKSQARKSQTWKARR